VHEKVSFFVKKNKFFFQMTNHKWDLKSNYMLAFTVCKYGLNTEKWNLIANELADYINTTPQVRITLFRLIFVFDNSVGSAI
jgi:hypothetical protein